VTAPVRLVMVEDSPVQPAQLREVLEADRDIAVVGQVHAAIRDAVARLVRP